MQFYLRMIFCGVLSLAPIAVYAQEDTAVLNVQISAPTSTLSSTDSLPDAPHAQDEEIDLAQLPALQPSLASAPEQSGNGQTGTPTSSSPQAAAPQSDAEKSEHEKAEEQLKEQEHQRVAGVMATFNTTTNHNALPLSSGQKFQLFFKSETDPWPFVLSGVVAGLNQASDSEPEWGQGMQGYAKRFGAGYSDSFIGNFFGNLYLHW